MVLKILLVAAIAGSRGVTLVGEVISASGGIERATALDKQWGVGFWLPDPLELSCF